VSATAIILAKPPVRAGDVVLHLRNAQRLYVESVERRVAYCVWFGSAGELLSGAYGVDWLIPQGMALA
jgi:hypothetical protein